MNVSAVKIRLSSGDSCNVTVEWDRPTGTSPEDIDHYVLRVSRNGICNETNTTSTLVTFSIGECTNNLSVNITTVDRCGREGPSSANVEPELLPPTDPVTTPSGTLSISTTTTTNTPNETDTTLGKVLGGVFGSCELINKDSNL